MAAVLDDSSPSNCSRTMPSKLPRAATFFVRASWADSSSCASMLKSRQDFAKALTARVTFAASPRFSAA